VKPQEEVETEIKTGKSFLVNKEGERPWVYMYATTNTTRLFATWTNSNVSKADAVCRYPSQ